MTFWGITAVHLFDLRWENENSTPDMGKFKEVFDLQVHQIGCAHLKNVVLDTLLFLSDTMTKHWASGNNYGRNGMSLGNRMRKEKI